jgi:protein TonB
MEEKRGKMGKWCGLTISILIHTMVLAIPGSIKVNSHSKQIEIFVIGEETQIQQKQITKQGEMRLPLKEQNIEEKAHLPQAASLREPISPVRTEFQLKEQEQEKLPEETSVIKNKAEIVERAGITDKANQKEVQGETLSKPSLSEVKTLSLSPQPSSLESFPITHYDTKPEIGFGNLSEPTSLNGSPNAPNTEFGSLGAPKFLFCEIPKYPLMARKLGREGKVILKLAIDEKGTLMNIEVIEDGGYGFTEAALDAVKKSKFLPAEKNGKPIKSLAILPVRFVLRRD